MKKRCVFCLLLLISLSANSYAQGAVQCGIFFDHDAVGNRTQRIYDCRALGQGWTSPGSTAKMIIAGNETVIPDKDTGKFATVLVYPNPTSGAFTIRLSEVPKEPLHFHWYSNQLQILGSGYISDISYSGSISNWADGIYILRVYDNEKINTFKIVKVTSSGQ